MAIRLPGRRRTAYYLLVLRDTSWGSKRSAAHPHDWEAEEERAVLHVRSQGALAMQAGHRGRPAAHEVIRPFLLERASTGATPLTGEDFEGFPTGIPEYDVGSFL